MSMNAQPSRLTRLLRAQGFTPVVHPPDEAAKLHERWRAVFASEVFARTGERVHLGYDWHACSYGFTESLAKEAALEAYRLTALAPLHLLPNDDDDDAPCLLLAAPAALPVLTDLDVSVVPHDFSWTMVFTHEDGYVGPFFARAPG
jgi:hypothetical protein